MSDDDDPQIDGDDPAPEPEIGDAADPRKLKAKKSLAKTEADEEREFIFRALGDRVGRRYLWNLLQAGKFSENSFAVGPNGFPQSEATWFAAGARDFAQRLHDSWQIVNFEGVHMMRCENDPLFRAAKPPLPKGGK